MNSARRDWWIISGAAVTLHGIRNKPVRDLDVLVHRADFRLVAQVLAFPPQADGGNRRFRSTYFETWTGWPLPVDFMAGLEVASGDGWTAVEPATRERVDVAGTTLFVPSRLELAEMLRSFGRDKDLRRADLLDRS